MALHEGRREKSKSDRFNSNPGMFRLEASYRASDNYDVKRFLGVTEGNASASLAGGRGRGRGGDVNVGKMQDCHLRNRVTVLHARTRNCDIVHVAVGLAHAYPWLHDPLPVEHFTFRPQGRTTIHKPLAGRYRGEIRICVARPRGAARRTPAAAFPACVHVFVCVRAPRGRRRVRSWAALNGHLFSRICVSLADARLTLACSSRRIERK